ncbi:MAG: putative sulfate exporter family transporter [Roseibium sp.]|nr:putative sulfate exporter family transporter [Roseibium sp.]
MTQEKTLKPSGLAQHFATLWPGLLVCGLAALAAQFLSDHYGAPAMLMALLLGLALHFLVQEETSCAPGVSFAARSILRIGVALLGARISFEVFAELGLGVIGLMVAGLIVTVAFGFLAARLLGRGWRLAILTSGAVAICGASAAMAIAAVLPRNEFSERNLSFTVFGVTLLSTIAMVVYPLVAQGFGLSDLAAGVFLGGTIHDVAQVVGAGFSVSESVGETSTTVKLIRVTLLAPFVLILTLSLRAFDAGRTEGAKAPPILPGFVAAFVVLACANSLGLVPSVLQEILWAISKWAMLTAIAAVGMKTELRRILKIPPQSVGLLCGETLFIAIFVLAGVMWLI